MRYIKNIVSIDNKYYTYTIFTRLRFTRIINIIFLVQFLKFNLIQFATLQSIFLFSQFIFEIPSGVLSDIFKRKTIIMMGLIVLSISPLVIAATSYLQLAKGSIYMLLAISFFMEGVGNALLSGADDALFYEGIREGGNEKEYSKIRGKVQLFGAIATGVATFLGGIFYEFESGLPYFLQTAALLLAMVIIFFVEDLNSGLEERQSKTKRQGIFDVLSVFKEMTRSPNICFLFSFIALTVATVDAVFTLLPDYVSKIGFSASLNGGIFMIYSLIGGLVATQSYRLSSLSYKKITFLVILVLLAGTLFDVQNNSYQFLIGIGLLYITEDILDPIVMGMLNLWVKDQSRATFISGLSFVISLVTMIINPIVGYAVQSYGTVNMLIAVSFGMIILFLAADVFILESKKIV